MNKLYIALILAFIPVIYFFLIYVLLSEEKRLILFRRNITCYYFDWVFILFNFFWIYVVVFNLSLFLILLGVSLIGNLFAHIYFIKIHKKERRKLYFLDKKQRDFIFPGIIHFVFSTLEASLVLMFLFSSLRTRLFYVESIILGFFFLGLIPASKKIHGKILWADLLFAILGILGLLIKISIF